MTTVTVTMTPEQAAALRKGHDTDARRYSRMTRAALVVTYRTALRARAREILFGGPGTKSEYATAILDLRYPRERLHEAIHVLHHKPGENWSACQWCHPHGGVRCECDLRGAA